MGGPVVFSTLVGSAWGTIWLPSLSHRGRSQREPPTKFKTQPKKVPIKNQRFQFWRLYPNFATSSMHVKVDRSFITADQFAYRLNRCLQLTCISLFRRRADAAVAWKRFTQTLVRLVFDCRREVDEGVSKNFVWITPRCEERSPVFQLDLHISKVT